MTVFATDVDADALLTEAGIVRIRSARPEDAAALRALHERVSPDTLYLRFFTMSPSLIGAEVDRLTRPADADHHSLVAEVHREVVGVATYERLSDGSQAEVAFLVDDAHQGRGIGMLLLEHLATVATAQGIVTFVAETLPANARMLHVFADAGFPVTTRLDDGVVQVAVPLRLDEDFRRAVDAREARA
ncbi:MAG: GNAT family N-acetyltransferase, partial [Actinomycetota bacterium]